MAETTLTASASSNNWRSGSSWPPATHVGNEDGSGTFFVNHEKDGGTYWAANGYLRFDGSSIPGGTITAANLRLYVGNFYQSKMDADNMSLAGEYYDYGGTTDSGDYAANVTSPCFTAIDITGITVGQYLEIPLTVLGGINTSGFFGFRLTFVPSGAPAGFNQLGFHSVPNSTGKPQLVVTTSDGGGTTPVGVDAEAVWDVHAAAGRAGDAVWPVRSVAATTGQAVWPVWVRAAADASAVWATRAAASADGVAVWPVRGRASRDGAATWTVRHLAGGSASAVWAVNAHASHDGACVWPVKAHASQAGTAVWTTRAHAGTLGHAAWPVHTTTRLDGQATWPVRGLTGNTGSAVWQVLAQAGTAGASGTATWTVRAHATADGTAAWAVHVTAAATGHAAWAVYVPVGESASAAWTVHTLAGDTATATWMAYGLAGADGHAIWQVHGPDGAPDPPGMVAALVRVHPAVNPHSTVTVPVGSQTRATTRARGVTTHG